MTPDELLTTTRAVRKRLDLTRPVPRELLLECVEIALQAPTGSNRQGWHFVFVEDADTKAALADLYRRGYDPYRAGPRPEYAADDPRGERQDSVMSSSDYLRDHFHEVPVMLVPVLHQRLPPDIDTVWQAGFWGSLLPAVWSFMLAARARGLGTAWTTLHLVHEREAAEVLGIPYERFTQGGLVPVAYHTGETFKPAKRLPAESVVHWDRW
ncbi:MAG TPA: nitroreductase family protein [Acidimicrobiales bacterium]|nr:nitroreductase family protein [Acidimicrobiales bacterium]